MLGVDLYSCVLYCRALTWLIFSTVAQDLVYAGFLYGALADSIRSVNHYKVCQLEERLEQSGLSLYSQATHTSSRGLAMAAACHEVDYHTHRHRANCSAMRWRFIILCLWTGNPYWYDRLLYTNTSVRPRFTYICVNVDLLNKKVISWWHTYRLKKGWKVEVLFLHS